MNIQNEIEQLEKQIANLKVKQKQEEEIERSKYRYLKHGDMYFNSNVDCKALIWNIGSKWGYVYYDGSGEIYDSKDKLEDALKNEKFTYVTDKARF